MAIIQVRDGPRSLVRVWMKQLKYGILKAELEDFLMDQMTGVRGESQE